MTIPGADRLCVGTAQFGMPYGIANQSGVPDQAHVTKMLATALDCGVERFDTAQDYGDSEAKLGAAIRELGVSDQVQVITKLHPEIDTQDKNAIVGAVMASRKLLGLPRLEVLLLHRPRKMTDWSSGLGQAVEELLRRQVIRKFGISAGSPAEITACHEHPVVSAFQVPCNALDRRFVTPNLFPPKAELFYRSVFLQGLLLMNENDAARNLPSAARAFQDLHGFCDEDGIDRATFLLAVVLRSTPRGSLVLGVETASQLNRNLDLMKEALDPAMDAPVATWLRRPGQYSEEILNPALWKIS